MNSISTADNSSQHHISPVREHVDWIVCVAAVFLQGLSFWAAPLYDPDMGFHLLGGAWTRITGDVPREDFLHAFNFRWVDYHWLGQLLMDRLNLLGGLPAVQLFCGIVTGALALVLVRIIQVAHPKASPLLTWAITAAALHALWGLVSSRPTTLAVLLVAMAFLFLLKRGAGSLLELVVLTIICANVHIYWVLIPGLWGVYCCLPRLLTTAKVGNSSALRSWGGLLLLLSCAAVSPYGIFNTEKGAGAILANYFVFADVVDMHPAVRARIDEMQGLSFGGFLGWYFLGSLLIVAFSLGRKLGLHDKNDAAGWSNWIKRILSNGLAWQAVAGWLLFLGTTWMITDAVKYTPFFLIAGAPILSRSLEAAGAWVVDKKSLLWVLRTGMAASCVLFGWQAWRTLPMAPGNAVIAIQNLREQAPIDVCFKIPDLIAPASGRIATHYNFGSWCAWAMNQRRMPARFKVTMDGRTQFISGDYLNRQFSMYELKDGWDKTLKDLDADAILIARNQPLLQGIKQLQAEWKLSYADRSYSLFSRIRRPEETTSHSRGS